MEIKYTVPAISADTLESYTYTNGDIISGQIRAIVLDFHGLGCCWLKKEPSAFDSLLASKGILTVFPYYGPWSWMNEQAVTYVDDVIAATCDKYGLDVNTIPIISTGGSMGGHSALIYTMYARRTPKACVTNCPVCDFAYHATEREDLPRTVYLAFSNASAPLKDAIELHSAYHLAPMMPDIPYLVLHGDKDSAVNKEIHSDRFVARMRECGKRVEYIEVEGMEHCDLGSFPETEKQYFEAIINFALN